MDKSKPFKNFAFISYSHTDKKAAEELQNVLDDFQLSDALKEKYPNRPEVLREIFRDDTGLPAGSNLTVEIQKQLDKSNYLIVICSPNAAKSEWVNKEIDYFKTHRDSTHIIPFIIDGVANAKDKDDQECFPSALKSLEARGANVSTFSFERAVVEVIAGALEIDVDDLWQRHVRAEEEKKRQLKEQRDNLLRVQSRFLAKEANECLNRHQFDKASLIALEALPINLDKPNRPYVKEADDALRESTIDTSPIIRFYKDSCIDINGTNYAVAEEGYAISIWNTQLDRCVKTIRLTDLIPQGLDNWQRSHGRFKLLKLVEIGESSNLFFSCNNYLYILDCLTEQVSLLYKSNLNDITFSDIILSPTRKHIICIATSNITSLGIHKYTFILNMNSLECNKDLSFNTSVSVSFSPNGGLIAFVGERSIYIYDIAHDTYTNKLKRTDVECGSFIDNSTFVFSCSDNSLNKWSLRSDEVELVYQCDSKIYGIISDKDLVSICTMSNDIVVIDINCQTAIAKRNWHSKIIFKSLSKNKSTLTYTDDNSFRTWNFRIRSNGQYLLYYHFSPISCVAYSTDYSSFVSASDECIKVWDVLQKRIIGDLAISSPISQMVLSSNHNRIIYDDYNGIWNLNYISGELKKLSPRAPKIQLSPDDKLVLIADANTIFLFDTISSELYKTLKVPEDQLIFGEDIIAFSPNGDYIAALTSPDDPSMMIATLWDVKSGVIITSISYEAGHGESVSFSPDGNTVIIDNNLMWDYRKNQIQAIDKTKEASSLKTTNESIVNDGIFVLMERNISLQELIDETRERFKDNPLTPEERKKYYLD